MHNVFVYGTLQIPEVMLAVTGRVWPSHPARLDGYARHRLRGKSFPGIRPCPNASVDGLLLLGVDMETQRKLDDFEDAFYRRDPVQVTAADGTRQVAQAYVVREEADGLLLPEDWDIETFKLSHMSAFLARHI